MKRISVMVCTRNRADAVSPCLDSITQSIRTAQMSFDHAEIIVVDNGSTDGTINTLVQWGAAHPDIDLKILKEPVAGLSQARNRGVANVSGDMIIFTDDDCRMAPDYILKAIAYDTTDKEDVIRGGRIELGDPSDIPLTIKTYDQPQLYSKSKQSAKYEAMSGFMSGCNMVLRKSTLDRLGRFDTRLGAGTSIPGSEDTDYLVRAYLEGIDIEYVPDMTVHHFHGRKTATDGKKLLRGYNMGAGALFMKYLLTDIDLFRPFVWNLRNAWNEVKTGKNLYLPEFNASYKEVVRMNLIGMWRYACVSLWSVLVEKSRGKQE